jgi:hypothetical protein
MHLIAYRPSSLEHSSVTTTLPRAPASYHTIQKYDRCFTLRKNEAGIDLFYWNPNILIKPILATRVAATETLPGIGLFINPNFRISVAFRNPLLSEFSAVHIPRTQLPAITLNSVVPWVYIFLELSSCYAFRPDVNAFISQPVYLLALTCWNPKWTAPRGIRFNTPR